MGKLEIYLRSEIELSEKQENESGLYKVRGKFINAGTVDRAWFKLEITEEAIQKAFATATKQGKIVAKYMHSENDVIGHASNFVLEDGFIKGDYFINPDVQRGKETISLIEKKTLDAFSIGFAITKYVTKEENGAETMVVSDFKIFEISVVDIPAVDEARIEEQFKVYFNKEGAAAPGEANILEKEKEEKFNKESVFTQIEQFQALGETFGMEAKFCLESAKKGLSVEAFKAEILEKKTEEFCLREEKLKTEEEALKVKQAELEASLKQVQTEFAVTLKKENLPLGDAGKTEDVQQYTGIDGAVQKLKEEKKWA